MVQTASLCTIPQEDATRMYTGMHAQSCVCTWAHVSLPHYWQILDFLIHSLAQIHF